MSAYRSGYLVELKAKDKLKKLGAKIVVRSSRSLTPADLIAIFPDRKEIWLVQCKAKQEAPKKPETLKRRFKDLKALAGNYTCRTMVYIKKEGKYTFIEV